MVTFKDYTYKRPNLEEDKAIFQGLLTKFKEATSVEEQSKAIEGINSFRNDYSTNANLVYIRASIDTNDEYYQKERDYFDETNPEVEEMITEYYKALVESPFRVELEEKWGNQLFDLADNQIKAFSPKIISLMQKENKLASDYSKLVASAQVEFNGETLTLAQLGPYAESTDRGTRKKAKETSSGFFHENEAKFDDLYDQLVKVRHEIATTLGYKNFVELGYIRKIGRAHV